MGRLYVLVLCAFTFNALMSKGFAENIMSKKIDLKSFTFVCMKEQKPVFDKEADQWFQQARAIEKRELPGTDAQVLALYEKAVTKNHYKAINNLAYIYVLGDIVGVDERKAVKLIELGIKIKSPSAYYTMGLYLEQGIGVEQDNEAAMAYYRKSADMGYPAGQYLVGEKLLLGDFGQSPEEDKVIMPVGIQMLECALEQGHAEAGLELGFYFSALDKHKERGLVYLQKSAALGNADALFALISAFENGTEGAPKDPERAACYDKLWNELDKDKNKKFPDIGRICPLPESF